MTSIRLQTLIPMLAAAVLLAPSCRTVEGRYLAADMRHGECVDGVPVTVQKARFLEVTYKTVIYGQQAGGRSAKLHDEECEVTGGYVITSTQDEIDTRIVTAAEVFAIDTKRPASGEITYGLQFDAGSSYPSQLTTKLDDTTVADIVELAKALKGGDKDLLADSVSEANQRMDARTRRELGLRGAGKLIKLTEAINSIEYYDLWRTDETGFPQFAFRVGMDDAEARLRPDGAAAAAPRGASR